MASVRDRKNPRSVVSAQGLYWGKFKITLATNEKTFLNRLSSKNRVIMHSPRVGMLTVKPGMM